MSKDEKMQKPKWLEKNPLLSIGSIPADLEDKKEIGYEHTVYSELEATFEENKKKTKDELDKTKQLNVLNREKKIKNELKRSRDDIITEHQRWATTYTRGMAIGLPILARIAVEGIIKHIFTNW